MTPKRRSLLRSRYGSELVRRKAGPACYMAHGEGVDGIVPGDLHDANSIGHRDVLPLANDLKSRLLKGADRLKVIDAGEAWHLSQRVITWRSILTLNRRSTSG